MRRISGPRPDETITVESLVTALRTTFQPAAARGLHAGFELRAGEIVLHARVDDGRLDAGPGALPGADITIEAGPALRALMAGEMSAAHALESGAVGVSGDSALLDRFAELFRIDALPPARHEGRQATRPGGSRAR